MITSPDSNRPASVVMVELVASPAGTITQATRGAVSLATTSSRVAAGSAPMAAAAAAGLVREIEGDHLVPVLDESLGHVGAHLAQADHGDLHGALLDVVRSGGAATAEWRTVRVVPTARVDRSDTGAGRRRPGSP